MQGLTEIPVPLSRWLARWKRLFIGGVWRDGASSETFQTYHPFHQTELAEISLAKKSDLELAVGRAGLAEKRGDWSLSPRLTRAEVLSKVASLILENQASLADLESLDTGKPVSHTQAKILEAARSFEKAGAYLRNLCDNRRGALGVVGVVTSAHNPLSEAARALAPALAVGNSCILKPSALAPLSSVFFMEIVAPLFPPAVLSLVQGPDENGAGEFLAAHPQLAALDFSGELATARGLLVAAAAGPAKVNLHVQWQGAIIVCADGNVDDVLNCLAAAAFEARTVCVEGNRAERFSIDLARLTTQAVRPLGKKNEANDVNWIVSFQNEYELIEQLNRNPAIGWASVWSSDPKKIERLANALTVSLVCANFLPGAEVFEATGPDAVNFFSRTKILQWKLTHDL